MACGLQDTLGGDSLPRRHYPFSLTLLPAGGQYPVSESPTQRPEGPRFPAPTALRTHRFLRATRESQRSTRRERARRSRPPAPGSARARAPGRQLKAATRPVGRRAPWARQLRWWLERAGVGDGGGRGRGSLVSAEESGEQDQRVGEARRAALRPRRARPGVPVPARAQHPRGGQLRSAPLAPPPSRPPAPRSRWPGRPAESPHSAARPASPY